jgi:hypothetical protein
LKVFQFFIGLITIVAIIVFGSIILKYDPNHLNVNIFILFFLSLFIFITGIATIIGNGIRKSINKNSLPSYYLTSLRQGLLISLSLSGLLLLHITKVLNLWDGILLVSAIILLEFYFRTR